MHIRNRRENRLTDAVQTEQPPALYMKSLTHNIEEKTI